MAETALHLGDFQLDTVVQGDSHQMIAALPNESIDVLVTSPPYWGQRISLGNGTEADPRHYIGSLRAIFIAVLPKMKADGIVWINIGDAFNTPVNWRLGDLKFSSLGPEKTGLAPTNSAYIKPRAKRKAFISDDEAWLQYGNLLALPYRLILNLCDDGYLFRGEVIWRKKNAMPEGRCRRPHRNHESIYLLAKNERHQFRSIDAYGRVGKDVVVFDPFSGSGTTGVAALKSDCSYLGFEIDPVQVEASNLRLRRRREYVAREPAFRPDGTLCDPTLPL
jgi:DNA modification methylase